MGAKTASATTNADGTFSLAMGSYAGPVMLQITGGTYTDEATGATMQLMAGDTMTALLPSMTAGQTLNGVQVTPLTSVAQTMAQHMSGGMTDANITAANTNVGKYFMVTDVLHDVPMNPLMSGSGNAATQDQINYGMALAAMSHYAQTQGMSSSSAMVTAMMNDATGLAAPRRRRQMARPSSPGSIRSSTIRSYNSRSSARSMPWASGTALTVNPWSER